MGRQTIWPGDRAAGKSYADQLAEINLALAGLERAIDELNKSNGTGASEEQPPVAPASSATQSTVVPLGATGVASTNYIDGEAQTRPAAPDQLLVLPSRSWSGQDELDNEDLRLLTRFLSGAAMWGADELLERLRFRQAEIDVGAVQLPPAQPLADAGAGDLARYFVLGSLAWGRRKILRLANDAFHASADATASLANTADRLTDNWLLRPLRDPVDAVLAHLAQEVRLRIEEGWQEEQISRWLAVQTIPDITHDTTDYVIDYVSENPQLAALVREQLNQQTLGLSDTVMDNSRSLSGSADTLVEGVIRKILHKTPRSKLPPSPLAGQPQNMYARPPRLTKGESDEEQ